MNLKRTATFAVVGAALAAWLAAAATSGRRVAAPIEPRMDPTDISARMLADETARLHERLTPAAAPRQPGRDLFRFTARSSSHSPSAAHAAVVAAPPAAVEAPPAIVRLVGLAEDPGPDGPIRTAILGLPGGIVFAKPGDVIEGRLTVTRISADVVEIVDGATNTTMRLGIR